VREDAAVKVVVSMSPVAVSRETAANALGIGLTLFEQRVQPELKVIRIGSKVLIPVDELRRWVERHQERVL
jgi:hypothetical protein